MQKTQKKYSICYNCEELDVKDLMCFTIKGRNIDDKNTIFDGDNFTIKICKDCAKSLNMSQEWFDNELDYDYSLDRYKHEIDILNIIENLPVQNQEYIYNTSNEFTDYTEIDRDDWIALNTYAE